jgi:hypothetical protein
LEKLNLNLIQIISYNNLCRTRKKHTLPEHLIFQPRAHFFSPHYARAPFPFFHPLTRNSQTLDHFSPHPVPAAAASFHHRRPSQPLQPPTTASESPSHGLAAPRAVTSTRASSRHRWLFVPWSAWRPDVRRSLAVCAVVLPRGVRGGAGSRAATVPPHA